MEINGVSLDLDIFDADVMAAYEQELATVAAQGEALQKQADVSAADSIRAQCRIIAAFFDNLFGAGTARRLLGEKQHLLASLDAFEAVVAALGEKQAQVAQRWQAYEKGSRR